MEPNKTDAEKLGSLVEALYDTMDPIIGERIVDFKIRMMEIGLELMKKNKSFAEGKNE